MPPPPLLGYNNNVRHRGRVFHIQTEDSGMGSPRIMTHLFADGGRIVKSIRTDYSEHLERIDMAQVVKNMMKEQHKAMFVALRSGELDELIGFHEDEPLTEAGKKLSPLADQFFLETSSGAAQSGAAQSGAAQSSAAQSSAAQPDGRRASGRDGQAIQISDGAPSLDPSAPPALASKGAPSPAAPQPKDASGAAAPAVNLPSAKPYAPSRPASIFSVPPPTSGSIFGEVAIDEKSLDEAILSYLAEDDEKGRPKK